MPDVVAAGDLVELTPAWESHVYPVSALLIEKMKLDGRMWKGNLPSYIFGAGTMGVVVSYEFDFLRNQTVFAIEFHIEKFQRSGGGRDRSDSIDKRVVLFSREGFQQAG